MESMKKCSKCKAVKELSDFYPHRSNKDGLCGICKVCCSKESRERYVKNKDYILKQNKRYRQQHRNQIKERRKIYRTHKMNTDVIYKLSYGLRRRLNNALNKNFKEG